MADLGLAGRIADGLLDSPLVPLIVIAALILGAWGLTVTPREDRPEIEIPTVAVTVQCPGCGAERVDELIARRLSTLARQLPDSADVRSAASADGALVTIEFAEGLDDTEAYTRTRELLMRNAGALPPEAGTPVVVTVGEERLVVLMLTLSGPEKDGNRPGRLREVAEELAGRLEILDGVRTVELFGGQGRALRVLADPRRLAAHGISLATLADAVAGAGVRLPADALYGNVVEEVSAGLLLRSAEDLRRIPVAAGPAGIVFLEDVAQVVDGSAADEQAVLYWQRRGAVTEPAITLAVTGVPGRNVSDVTARVRAEARRQASRLVPAELRLTFGYDAGQEATDRVFSVLNQLLTGTLVVVGIIWLGLGWRAAVVIALMMPASLAIVPYAYYQLGYTLNPVSIAAMILAIGILADDAIIMLENIARMYRLRGERSRDLTVEAVDEVGNPTILADLLIVATLLPTAYISGEMGQYARAIPIGASIAVLFSLLIALSITPYFGFRLLRPSRGGRSSASASVAGDVAPNGGGFFAGAYQRLLTPFLDRPALRWLLYAAMLVLLAAAFALVFSRQVQIGLTPLLDRDLFVVEIQSPRGTPLTHSLAAAAAAGQELGEIAEVESYTIYAGLDAPLVLPPADAPAIGPARPETVSLYVDLVPEEDRERLSYVINRGLAERLDEVLAPWSARAYLRRIPSGPSSERAVEAEIHADSEQRRLALADGVAEILGRLDAVTSVERTPREAPPALAVEVDQTRAAARGVIAGEAARIVRIALSGATPASLHVPDSRRPVPIVVRLPREERREAEDLTGLFVDAADGSQVPLLDVVRLVPDEERGVRHRRNGRGVVYVGADLDRSVAEPLTVQQIAGDPIAGLPTSPSIHWFAPPLADERAAVYWGGEWETTRQVYRDLGVAGAVVMVLVYVLMAGWFRSYGAPLLIMLPIPLIFIGVIPAHWLWGIDIAGTGVMGMIALIGIVARNAVLLVDFVRRRQQDMDLREAVIRAGALRTRPILLTAGTVMFGSGVLIFEPALEPLGLTLASGVLVSTLLTLVLIPVLYFHCYADGNRRVS